MTGPKENDPGATGGNTGAVGEGICVGTAAFGKINQNPDVVKHKYAAVPRSDLVTEPANSFGINGFDARDYCFLLGHRRCFFNMKNGERFSRGGFRITHNRNVPVVVASNGDRSEIDVVDFAMDWVCIPIVSGEAYMPDIADRIVERDGKLVVNSHILETVPETNENWQASPVWHLCECHLIGVFGHEYADELLLWLAATVQRKKLHWSPLIFSKGYIGKTAIVDMLRAALGDENVASITVPEYWRRPDPETVMANTSVFAIDDLHDVQPDNVSSSHSLTSRGLSLF